MKSIIKFSQLKRNAFSGALQSLSGVVVLIITYPIIIKFLGYNIFGIWATLSIIIKMGDLGNLGITSALMKLIAEDWSMGNKKQIQDYISGSFIILCATSIVIMISSFALNGSILKLLNVSNEYQEMVSALIPMVAVVSILTIINNNLKAILTGIGRMDLANIIFIFGTLLKGLCSVLFLYMKLWIWALPLSFGISNVIVLIVYVNFLKKYNLSNLFIFKEINAKSFRRLLSFGGAIVGSQSLNILGVSLIKIFIARSFGFSEVSIFEITWRIVSNIRNIVLKIVIAIMPKVSQLNSMNRFLSMKRIYWKAIGFVTLIVAICFIIIFFFSTEILKFWLKGDFSPSIIVSLKILSIGWIGSLFFVPAYFYLMGINKERHCFYESLIKILFLVIGFCFLNYNGNLSFINIIFVTSLSVIISHIYIGSVLHFNKLYMPKA